MSDQSYDRVRQLVKNLGLKHKGGGAYEKDGEYYGRVTKDKGQYVLKRAGKMQKGRMLSKSKVEYKPEVKKKLIDVINNLPDPDSSYPMDKQPDSVKKDLKKFGLGTTYDGDKVYDKMMKAFDKALKPEDKEGQRLKKKIEDKWKKRGSLGGADKNDKLIFGGDETIGALFNHIRLSGERADPDRGPETDVKDKPKTIDKVEKKTYEVFVNIPYENVEGGQGQGNEDPEDDEERPDDEQIYINIKAENDEEAQARADVEADEAYDKLVKRAAKKYQYHRPDYDMMEVEVNEIESKSKKESIERKNMVKENLNKFVDSLAKGDNVEAKDAFNNVMADKVSSALDTTKQNIATSLYQQPETPNSVVGVDTPDNVEVANDDNAQ
jgi:hypothetical protein